MSCCDPFPEEIKSVCTNNNCAEGKRVTWSGKFDLLAAANGNSFNTLAVAAGGGAAAQRGDYVELKPYGSGKLHALAFIIDGVDATGAEFKTLVGYGEIFHNGKGVRPTLQSSFKNYTTCGEATDPDIYLKNGINPLNPQCLPAFSEQAPLQIAMDAGGADRTGVCITAVAMYVSGSMNG